MAEIGDIEGLFTLILSLFLHLSSGLKKITQALLYPTIPIVIL
jgi:hypothetical protein